MSSNVFQELSETDSMYDFFLSYATQDDEPAIHGEEKSRWISTFFETLKTRLGFHLGRKAKPFLDRSELEGNAPLSTGITNALDSSRLFLAVSTFTYYERPWCEKERQYFIRRLGDNPANSRRLFVAHQTCINPINPNSWQLSFFPDVRGYFFYKELSQTQGGGYRTFGFPFVDDANAAEYAGAIDSLAREMAKRIKELEYSQTSPKASSDVASQKPDAETVLLAPCAFLMRKEFEELRRAIEDADFLTVSPSTIDQETPDLFRKCIAFVQIVSPALLEEPGDSSGVTLDRRLWETAGHEGRPSFRWRSEDLDVNALARLYPGHEDFASKEVRQQLFAKFKKDLIDELGALRERHRIAAKTGGGKVVLLAAGADDLASASFLEPIFRKHGIGVYITEDPAAEILSEDMGALLVYFGKSDPRWVQQRLGVVRTLPKPRRSAIPVCIYFEKPPPAHAEKPLFYSMPEFHQVQWDDDSGFLKFVQSIASQT